MSQIHRRPARTRLLLLGIACAGVVVATVAALFTRACDEPTDLNAAGPLAGGAPLDRLLSRTGLAFSLHAWGGWGLDLAGCAPDAAGLQWMKAAWHAESPAQEQVVADGLRVTVTRAGGPEQLAPSLCPRLGTSLNPPQARVARKVGIACDPFTQPP